MKKSLTLGMLLLGCCLAAIAQTNQPTFNPLAPPQNSSASAPMVRATTAQGCLTQSADGNFMLADASGTNFQLRGDSSQLSSYIGNEVRVDGTPVGDSATAGSMSSPTSSDSSASSSTPRQFNVTNIHKISGTCATLPSAK